MRQGLVWLNHSLRLRRGCAEVQTQWAIQRVVAGWCSIGILFPYHHQLHRVASGANQLKGLRMHKRGCNSYTDGQHEPRQNEAGQS